MLFYKRVRQKRKEKKSIIDPLLISGKRVFKKVKTVPLKLSTPQFFKFLISLSRLFFKYSSSLVFKKSPLFFHLFFSVFNNILYYNLACLQKRGPRAVLDDTNDYKLLGNLKSFKLLELERANVYYGFFTKDFFSTYKVKKMVPLFRRTFGWYTIENFAKFRMYIDNIFFFKYNESISAWAYFFPGMRTSLIHVPRYIEFEGHYALKWPRIGNLFEYFLESYILNLYFCKFIFFKLAVLKYPSFTFFNSKATTNALNFNPIFGTLYSLKKALGSDRLLNIIWAFYVSFFFYFTCVLILRLPKRLYWTKFWFPTIISLIFVAFAHRPFYVFSFKSFYRSFYKKFFLWHVNEKYHLNPSFASIFFLRDDYDFSKIFYSKITRMAIILPQEDFDSDDDSLYFYDKPGLSKEEILAIEPTPITFSDRLDQEDDYEVLLVPGKSHFAYIHEFWKSEWIWHNYIEIAYVEDEMEVFRRIFSALSFYKDYDFSAFFQPFYEKIIFYTFWESFNFGILDKFFYYCINFYAIFDKIYVDWFLTNYLLSTWFFFWKTYDILGSVESLPRLGARPPSEVPPIKLPELMQLYNFRSILFRFFNFSPILFYCFFFSMPKRQRLRFRRFVLKNSFIELRLFYRLPHVEKNVIDLTEKNFPPCDYLFIK